MENKQFKAESKRLLELMIHSIYTHKEIFLRELISNASDAIDKLHFRSLTDQGVGLTTEDFEISLTVDKDARLLTIEDNGIGMTKEELEENLGTIARSGSLQFKNEHEKAEDMEIIGQFGVGFYSAFMVSDDVTVTSKAYGSEQGYRWHSAGSEGYTIESCDKDSVGTKIVLKVKENTEDENYDEFLQEYRLRALVKKYSDYIRYPIRMDMTTQVPKEDSEGEYETVTERTTLNSMVPLWRKNKNEVTTEEYEGFYREKFYDFEKPLQVIHSKTEGAVSYDALLFLPAKVPFNYYSKEFEKGLQLYANGVLIMEKCGDLLPDYFSFVRGLVDCADLSLNISREMLQHDRQLQLIAKSVEKKIRSELQKMLKTDREKYEEFFAAFGLQLKFGAYNHYGTDKDKLQDLLLFYSSFEKKPVTLAEYVSRMPEAQDKIYFVSGESVEQIDRLPQTELCKDKGFEILYLTDDVDEFCLQVLREYDGKQFQSISSAEFDLETEEEKEETKKQTEAHKGMLEAMQNALQDKVQAVTLSKRLKTHPVCLSTEGAVSLEMEKVLNAMPGSEAQVKAKRVLEINAGHPVFGVLANLHQTDADKLAKYTQMLYTQALLIEGMPIEDPVAFSNMICDLMAEHSEHHFSQE